MLKTSFKLENVVLSEMKLNDLVLGESVYFSVSENMYCDYMKLTKVDDNKYELISVWEKEDGSFTMEESEGSGYALKYILNFDKEIVKEAVSIDDFEYTTEVFDVLAIDDLYNYMLEEPHCYLDDNRNELSLRTYKTVVIK